VELAPQLLVKPPAERVPVQILVGVASIQMGCVRTEVERGSMRTVIEHGLAGPETQESSMCAGIVPVAR